MSMILHGIETSNTLHINVFLENIKAGGKDGIVY
jgi:hypothetical protein